MDRFICIHGHFYQPPRENPWLEAIEIQDSAYPYHDWNERITAECYAPNSVSRIVDSDNRIVDIVGNYAKISFNFGPTLLSWMQTNAPNAYQAIIDADRESTEARSGHGNALAQAYGHLIMPLANKRDKRTQIKWGLRDFEYRFGHAPEGMWLPETAVDLETLDIMAEHGIRFTILASHQAAKIKSLKAKQWEDVSGSRIDPTRAYLCRLPSGRSINILFYDGPISKAVAFENILNSGEDFVNRLLTGFSDQRGWAQICHIATDGETYGHHHKFGDMALAFALHQIEARGIAKLTNYGEYLEKYPPAHEVWIIDNTSWSCAHGVERWRADCGCNSGGHAGWNQAWRTPLRETFDWLRDRLVDPFTAKSEGLLKDPWAARDDYVDVLLDRTDENIEKFLQAHAAKELEQADKNSVLKLMEMQRHLMLMYTSCGWFFDELSGIETVQVIHYAGRAIQLARELFGLTLEDEFKVRLAAAKSNLAEVGDGARVYDRFVKPAMVDLGNVAAHYAISSLIEEYDNPARIYCYNVDREDYQKLQTGQARLALGRIGVASTITRETEVAGFSVLHLGGHIFNGGVEARLDNSAYQTMKEEMIAAFEKGSFADIIRLIDRRSGMQTYSLLNLFRDEQRKILLHVIDETLEGSEHAYRLMYENSRVLMLFVQDAGMTVPKTFLASAEFVLNREIKQALEKEQIDLEQIRKALTEIARWRLSLNEVEVEFNVRRKLEEMVDRLREFHADLSLLSQIHALTALLPSLPFLVNTWYLQNRYFDLAKDVYGGMLSKAQTGDSNAAKWIETFTAIGKALSFNTDAVLQPLFHSGTAPEK